MASFYDEIELEDFEYEQSSQTYFYPCPCGDRFQISLEELKNGEEIARCPSCSLMLRVIYDIGIKFEETPPPCSVVVS